MSITSISTSVSITIIIIAIISFCLAASGWGVGFTSRGLAGGCESLRVQVPNNHILTQNLYHNYYYPNPKYLIIGYMDPLGIGREARILGLIAVLKTGSWLGFKTWAEGGNQRAVCGMLLW